MAAATADTITTHQALARGGKEANPFVPEYTPALAAIKIGGWLALRNIELWVERSFEDQGIEVRWYHRLLIYAPAIVIQSWAAIHNHGVMR